MRRFVLVALFATSCSDAAPGRARPGLSALADLEYATTDPLLAAARTALAGGTLDPDVRAALLASKDPAHARAQRILLAMEPTRATAAPPIPDDRDTPAPGAATQRAPMLRVTTPPPEPIVPASTTSVPLPPPPAPVAAPRPTPTLRSVGLQRTRSGASLSLTGTGGLVVGVANQPTSGIVHLVMEATAVEGALRARPRVEGARVTGVRKTGRSVFVTLSLDPGWRLGGIVRSASGAKVTLRRPA